MSKIQWLLAALGVALAGLVPVLGVSAPAGGDPGTILKFTTMTPVTGPYTGIANPIRGVPGGIFPWIITTGNGALKSDGRCWCTCAAWSWPTGPRFRPRCRAPTGPRVRRLVSCQAISAADAATVTNVSTAVFPASTAGNADINATVSLPHPCIAPIVFVASPVFGWFAATGG